jgi:hypothetical protein
MTMTDEEQRDREIEVKNWGKFLLITKHITFTLRMSTKNKVFLKKMSSI